MKRLHQLVFAFAVLIFSWTTSLAQSDTNAAIGRLPDTDDGLPGAGPIRRYDWFRKLWAERRIAWSKRGAQDRGAVVFLGDSITQGWGDNFDRHFPGMKIANRGISGDTTRGVLIRLKEDVLDLQPRAVVLLIGTNDLEEQADPEIIVSNLKLLLAALKAHNANMPIILCQVFPSSDSKKRPAAKIKKLNQLYAALVKGDPQVTLLETWPLFANAQDDAKPEEFPDLLHPNQAGYAKWAASLRPVLETLGLLKPTPIPVILDTDIGDDIDDTWALALLLKSPELDLKLVVGDYGEAQYRAKLLAKYLERAGRSDVPVGIGLDIAPFGGDRQAAWIKDYDLKTYPGRILTNGMQAIIDTVMKSTQTVTLICIGPVPNIAEALKREPRIAQRARFVGMHGSVRGGYQGAKQPIAEWNVKCDPKALQQVFAAPWDITITPLDTCGLVTLPGAKYRRVLESTNRLATDLITNYRHWLINEPKLAQDMADRHSSTLYDAVAVYLAVRQDLCVMEKLNLRVTDDGFTVVDPQGKPVNVATKWKDLSAFEDFLVERLADRR